MKELLALTAHELMAKFAAGEVAPEEFYALQMRFARHIEPKVRSFLTLAEEGVAPPKVDTRKGALSGIPVSIKDLLTTTDFPTTAGSRILEGYAPPYDATAVRLLREAGNYFTGKTNLDEFGMGSSTENSAYFPTHNPWDLARVPGGSSGGSASSVAALQSVVSLGTDTGGSVRQPAGFCGVVGFVPTYGYISRNGLIAFASSLDHVGIVARDVTDVALTMNVIGRPDRLDATSQAPPDADYLAAMNDRESVGGCTVGVINQLMDPNLMAEDVLVACEVAIRVLENAGCGVKRVDLAGVKRLLPCYYILCPAEASSNLARYDGIRYGTGFPADVSRTLQEHYLAVRSPGFGEEVRRRILLGTYVLSAGYAEAYYNQARRVRHAITEGIADMFEDVDFLFLPTSPTTAFGLGDRIDDPVKMYAADICTVMANLASTPAISLPGGLSPQGMPVGVQFMAPQKHDGRLLALARLYEKSAGAEYSVPPLVAEELAGFEE